MTTFGGAGEPGEDAPAAAVRELAEELAVQALTHQLRHLVTQDKREDDGTAVRCVIYLLDVQDVTVLQAFEGEGTLVGTPDELVTHPALTPTCRSAVRAALDLRIDLPIADPHSCPSAADDSGAGPSATTVWLPSANASGETRHGQ